MHLACFLGRAPEEFKSGWLSIIGQQTCGSPASCYSSMESKIWYSWAINCLGLSDPTFMRLRASATPLSSIWLDPSSRSVFRVSLSWCQSATLKIKGQPHPLTYWKFWFRHRSLSSSWFNFSSSADNYRPLICWLTQVTTLIWGDRGLACKEPAISTC